MKVCKIEGCNIIHYAKEFCKCHYDRDKAGKPMIPIISKPNKPKDYQYCHVEGCDNKYYAKGYCRKHYVTPPASRKTSKCKAFEYCGNNAINDYCHTHKQRIEKNMSLNLSVKYSNKGERNGHWKGGVSVYEDHSAFKKNRLIILESSNYRCQECGDKAAVVHHLDGTKSNHNLDNLIAVCQKCHINIYHKGCVGRSKKYGKLTLREIAKRVGCCVNTISRHMDTEEKSVKFGDLIDKVMREETK